MARSKRKPGKLRCIDEAFCAKARSARRCAALAAPTTAGERELPHPASSRGGDVAYGDEAVAQVPLRVSASSRFSDAISFSCTCIVATTILR
jgi:hypothetical protein